MCLVVASACLSADPVQEGRALYAENGCASCHGPSGGGDGTISQQLDPRPTDLRNAQLFKLGSDVDTIAQTIATGMSTEPAALASPEFAQHRHSQGMPPFAHLTPSERRSLAAYIFSMQPRAKKGQQP